MAGVKFLSYQGKKLPIKMGIFTMMLVQEEYGVVMGDTGLENIDGSSLKPSQYIPLLFYALEQGHRISKKEFSMEQEDMHDILNECFMEFVTAIPSFFPDAEDVLEKIKGVEKKVAKTPPGKNAKKKLPTTRSSSGKQSQPSRSGQK